MASIDLKDAYYYVKIHPSHQKFLKFRHNGTLYMCTANPNGLASCPCKVTKLSKPVTAKLHNQGNIIAGYLDDFS